MNKNSRVVDALVYLQERCEYERQDRMTNRFNFKCVSIVVTTGPDLAIFGLVNNYDTLHKLLKTIKRKFDI